MNKSQVPGKTHVGARQRWKRKEHKVGTHENGLYRTQSIKNEEEQDKRRDDQERGCMEPGNSTTTIFTIPHGDCVNSAISHP
jgi:hypothetical protein